MIEQMAVYYCGWGQDWLLGHLADDGHNLLFEYSPQALQTGLELSPLHLPLRAQAYGGFPWHQHRLPGLIADSLPDGWGLLLMDRLFRQQKLPAPSPFKQAAQLPQRFARFNHLPDIRKTTQKQLLAQIKACAQALSPL